LSNNYDFGELTRLLEAENPCQTITIKQDSIKQNLLKPTFQETILKSFFPKTGFLSAIEYTDLDTKHNARVALICLLEEAKYQDCDIVKKLYTFRKKISKEKFTRAINLSKNS
jgi:hypothetical protein